MLWLWCLCTSMSKAVHRYDLCYDTYLSLVILVIICIPILQSNTSIKVSTKKVDELIYKIKDKIAPEIIEQIRILVEKDNRHMRQVAKGHFQTSFVINLLKYLSSKYGKNKSISISKEALYAMLVTCFPECKVNCLERNTIKLRVQAAEKALLP